MRLTPTMRMADTTKPGRTGSMVATPKAFRRKVAAMPPTMAAAAPSFVPLLQYTRNNTGMKKAEAMRAVKRRTMH